MQPKNQVTRERAVGEQSFGASPKPMLDESRTGLSGHDKQQGDLQDVDASRGQPREAGTAGERTPHQDAQPGADVRGQPSMVKKEEALPEGLRRERKGPYDKDVGRNEAATQVPKNWNPKEGI